MKALAQAPNRRPSFSCKPTQGAIVESPCLEEKKHAGCHDRRKSMEPGLGKVSIYGSDVGSCRATEQRLPQLPTNKEHHSKNLYTEHPAKTLITLCSPKTRTNLFITKDTHAPSSRDPSNSLYLTYCTRVSHIKPSQIPLSRADAIQVILIILKPKPKSKHNLPQPLPIERRNISVGCFHFAGQRPG
jgi:hypothetical protein